MAHSIPFCVVLAPPGLPDAQPGIYHNKLVWVINGVNGPKWPVAVYCQRHDQATALNSRLNPFIALHGEEDAVTFRSSLRGWEEWPEITGLFDQAGTMFWSVIFGARSGIFYHEEHAADQMERSPPQYRAAFGFDRFENALICQMSRSSNIIGLLARLPRSQIGPGRRNLRQTSVPDPDVPSPDTSAGSSVQKQQHKKSNTDLSPSKMHNQGSPSKGAHLTSNVYITNSGNNEVFSTPLRRNVQDAVRQSPARQSSPQKTSQTSLRLPRLLHHYLEIYQYPEEVISQNLDMAEDRDDFVETMTFNGVPEEASGFIWEMYFGLVGICF
ncbi:hypothetical protein ARMSODRAFT_1024838 [Armillaria solidipes]|uniref:Uncharacterized protein n=1 Tax=Armillaria solidipes TaxID=1076256 RepID=A0A2H3B5U9_9AGAR|nr:hypothetical protein ARMSODRAFT_1024838 [Armillaria solidipes]